MRIGIDARMYGPRVGGGGLGRYVEQVILHLQQVDEENEYVVFLKRENFDECPIPNERWTKIVADQHWYTAAEQTRLPHIIDKQVLDLMHFPHFNVPLRLKTPYVVTIHDLIMLDQPWSARASTRNRIVFALKHAAFRFTLQRAAQRAREIVTVSEHAKTQIIHRLGTSPSKVHVVYNGVEHWPKKTSKDPLKSLRESSVPYGVSTPYLLNVGNAYPHKNLETLLHAFSFLLEAYPKLSLVLVGPDDAFRERLREEAREIAIPDDRIFFLGFVSDEELERLYTHTTAYVIPSHLEGFGIPPLEALRHGTPVAASRASSIPEILGDAALYFNPNDIEDQVTAIDTLMRDRSLRTRLVTNGQRVLARYSWRTHAETLRDIYRRAGDA